MSRWSRPVTGLVITVLVAPVLVACGGGADPGAEGTPTPKFSEATSSAASADASESASPSESAEATPKTPEQVARAYLDGLSAAINSGETSAFLQYATGACKNCASVSDVIDARYGAGGRIENEAGWTMVSFRRLGPSPEGAGTVYTAEVDVGSQRSFDAAGKVESRSQASTQTCNFLIRRVDGNLRIVQWDVRA